MESLPNDWIRGSPTGTQRHFELPTTAKLNPNVMKPFGPCVDDRGKNFLRTQRHYDDHLLGSKKLKPGPANFVEANHRMTRLIGKASIGQTALQIGTFDNYRFSKQNILAGSCATRFLRGFFRAQWLMTKNLLGDWGQRGLYFGRHPRPPQEESRRTTKMARSDTGTESLICDTALIERRKLESKAFLYAPT